MNVLAESITAGGQMLDFVKANNHTDDMQSLTPQLAWNNRVLEMLNKYFAHERTLQANEIRAPGDAALLEQIASHLDTFLSDVQQFLRTIERREILNSTSDAVWIDSPGDLQIVAKDMYNWIRRFNVRLLSLPHELRGIITAGEDGPSIPAVVKSNNTLREFLSLASDAKQAQGQTLLLELSEDFAALITRRGDASYQPLRYGSDELIFAARRVSLEEALETTSFRSIMDEMGEIAAALHCLDPAADIKLLKVEYYFYHADSNQLLFAHKPPYPTVSMMTLAQMIAGDPFPRVESPLGERLTVAFKIAEAVFYLHTAGFLHKSITSSSVVALRPLHLSPGAAVPDIEDSYLMCFNLIRDREEGSARMQKDAEKAHFWEIEIFKHPNWSTKKNAPKYVKAYDVYSLGVLLLEVGLWEPLHNIASSRALDLSDPLARPTELSKLAPELGSRVGRSYEALVRWCLDQQVNDIISDNDFLERVLDPLVKILRAISGSQASSYGQYT